MRFVKKTLVANSKNDFFDTIDDLASNPSFIKALPGMIDAAGAAIKVGEQQNKPDMIKFNTLVVKFCRALLKKDLKDAIEAAEDLVKSGHGEAFGL